MKPENKKRIIGIIILVIILLVTLFLCLFNKKETKPILVNWGIQLTKTSGLNIQITDVESKLLKGKASNEEKPVWGKISADFNTKLVNLKDSMKYDITIENKGTNEAILEDIEISKLDNKIVKVETKELDKNSTLKPKEKTTFTVIITYNKKVTSKLKNKNLKLNVKLNFTDTLKKDSIVSTNKTNSVPNNINQKTLVAINHFQNIEDDKTAPVITGVEEGMYYNTTITPQITDDSEVITTLNGEKYIPGTEITEEGKYTLAVTDKAGNKTTVNFVIDKTAPVINIDKNVTINHGESFIEDVYDNVSDNYTAKEDLNINIKGTVNDKVAGTYTLTYTVTDKARNTNIVKRTVVVSPYVTFIDGPTFNQKIRSLNANVETIRKADAQPTTDNYIEVQTEDSNTSIKMWLDKNNNKQMLWYTQDENPRLNSNSSNMFSNLTNLISLDISNFNTSNVINMASMFYNCSRLTSLDLSNLDTHNVINMASMFYNCSRLTSLDLSNLDTRNVTNMGSMFYNCRNLTTLDVSNFNTSNVTNMFGMFYNCSNLTTLDVSNFNTSNVINMANMFYNCSNLTTLDLSNFNTNNVINMANMFYNCSNLTTLNLSNFNTSNVTDMAYMFYNCSNLTTLDLNSFNTIKVKYMSRMFYGCSRLITIYVSPTWTTDLATTSNMFTNCGTTGVTLKE